MTQNHSLKTDFLILSPAFRNGTNIPIQYTCKGQNVSPPINIIGVPGETKSLALIMHDPDAINGDFTHWLMWGIPADTENIAANSMPVSAICGLNDAGQNSYFGPCPPAGTGTHRYTFELYALDLTLDLPPQTQRAMLEQTINTHIISRCNLVGLFGAE